MFSGEALNDNPIGEREIIKIIFSIKEFFPNDTKYFRDNLLVTPPLKNEPLLLTLYTIYGPHNYERGYKGFTKTFSEFLNDKEYFNETVTVIYDNFRKNNGATDERIKKFMRNFSSFSSLGLYHDDVLFNVLGQYKISNILNIVYLFERIKSEEEKVKFLNFIMRITREYDEIIDDDFYETIASKKFGRTLDKRTRMNNFSFLYPFLVHHSLWLENNDEDHMTKTMKVLYSGALTYKFNDDEPPIYVNFKLDELFGGDYKKYYNFCNDFESYHEGEDYYDENYDNYRTYTIDFILENYRDEMPLSWWMELSK